MAFLGSGPAGTAGHCGGECCPAATSVCANNEQFGGQACCASLPLRMPDSRSSLAVQVDPYPVTLWHHKITEFAGNCCPCDPSAG